MFFEDCARWSWPAYWAQPAAVSFHSGCRMDGSEPRASNVSTQFSVIGERCFVQSRAAVVGRSHTAATETAAARASEAASNTA